MENFNVEKATRHIIKWIKDWFEENGPTCNAIVGISGGKDSSVVAALCVEALGKERVIGVKMPQGVQKDIDASNKLIEHLGIKAIEVNIGAVVDEAKKALAIAGVEMTAQANTNLPARIRMTTLYAVSQSNNGRVANTCNASEDFVGYSTKYGDAAGDFSPLSNYTVREILQIGDHIGIPYELVHKTPIDGLNTNPDGSYVTDEQSLGMTYAEIDDYIEKGVCRPEIKEKLLTMNKRAIAKNKMLKCPHD